MPFRVTDSINNSTLIAQIGRQRQRLSVAQEQVSSGRRINRPSDDPAGAEAVIRLRSTQVELEQFRKSASAAGDKLTHADGLLSDFQLKLDRIQTILAQGVSDTTTQEARNALATEIDSLRQQILSIANSTAGGEYVFGGTRQNISPFDVAGNPAATPTQIQQLQIEPNATPIATGVIAESVFSDATGTIFAELTNAAAALRGTGNPAADRTTLQGVQSRIETFSSQSKDAQGRIGANQQHVTDVLTRLERTHFALEESAQNIEGVDLAEAAIAFTEAQTALEATLQTSARFGRRSLLDFLG